MNDLKANTPQDTTINSLTFVELIQKRKIINIFFGSVLFCLVMRKIINIISIIINFKILLNKITTIVTCISVACVRHQHLSKTPTLIEYQTCLQSKV